jgi:hypothetical protein
MSPDRHRSSLYTTTASNLISTSVWIDLCHLSSRSPLYSLFHFVAFHSFAESQIVPSGTLSFTKPSSYTPTAISQISSTKARTHLQSTGILCGSYRLLKSKWIKCRMLISRWRSISICLVISVACPTRFLWFRLGGFCKCVITS